MATQADLDDARRQLHLLLTGQAAAVVVDHNGMRVEYRASSAGRLAAYVKQLEAEITGQTRPNVIRFTTSKGLS